MFKIYAGKIVILPYNLKYFKNQVKNLDSAVIILREAVANETAILELDNIKDNFEELILKVADLIVLYKNLSELLFENETCIQINLLLIDINSLCNILKYSISTKRTKITYEDIFNCLNVISKMTKQVYEYSKKITPELDYDNVKPFKPIE